MRVATVNLDGEALNWAVAVALGFEEQIAVTTYGDGEEEVFFQYPVRDSRDEVVWSRGDRFQPTTRALQAMPIIHGNRICVNAYVEPADLWSAHVFVGRVLSHHLNGATPLVAAMRCYVSLRIGDSVDIPDTLVRV